MQRLLEQSIADLFANNHRSRFYKLVHGFFGSWGIVL
jgi:hypothetical protein